MKSKVLSAGLMFIGLVLAGGLPSAYAQEYVSPVHMFSLQDVQGGFNGSTVGPAGAIQDPTIVCGASAIVPGSPACPKGVAPIVDKEGVTLYPIDSEFGFNVVDFLGAQVKARNNDYLEGFVGQIATGGVKISNAATDTYRVRAPLGTWCQGLGGNSVKCSTEHFTAMEHVLSCHEAVPYFYADPLTGTQATLSFPDGSASFNCANAELDNILKIVKDGVISTDVLAVPTDGTLPMTPNDNTTVLNDIAVSADYSVTIKDDGKALYRWGGLIKRPNDIRMYARIPLPAAWKVSGADYKVTSAKLVVTHWITNNPNDQLRPEDLENEAATGRKPSYRVEANDVWKSIKPCYEGDGDVIDTEEGSVDPTFIGVGTVFKNTPFAGTNLVGVSDPALLSSDLTGGFTNGYYTTIERDPFEWSYRKAGTADNVFEFFGLPLPDPSLAAQLVSGPRWRLKANKFGQDLPGLEIPRVECTPPPYEKGDIKYEVGAVTTTVINLLDWEAGVPSPLATSKGWVDYVANGENIYAQTVNGVPVSVNGLPLTEDFDLAVYVKGDKKPTAVISAQLYIDSEPVVAPPPVGTIQIASLNVPDSVKLLQVRIVSVTLTNESTTISAGTLTLSNDAGFNRTAAFSLAAGATKRFNFTWINLEPPGTVIKWTATAATTNGYTDIETANTTVTYRGR